MPGESPPAGHGPTMGAHFATTGTRVTAFAPRIDELLLRYRGADVFRLERDTIGVAGADVMDELLRSRPADDVLLLPLLSHRDPALWDDPEEFRPERWEALDPETHPGYLPFGHSGERCW